MRDRDRKKREEWRKMQTNTKPQSDGNDEERWQKREKEQNIPRKIHSI
jgi:hypothetical protein